MTLVTLLTLLSNNGDERLVKSDMRGERGMSGEGQREAMRGQEVSGLSCPSCQKGSL